MVILHDLAVILMVIQWHSMGNSMGISWDSTNPPTGLFLWVL
jgi:hypothetical protein